MSTKNDQHEAGDELVYEEPPYRQVPDAVTFHPELSDVDVRLFIALVWFARSGNGAFPGRKALAKKIHKKSIRTIDDAINRLIAAGFLVVVARYHDNGGRRSSLYRLFAQPLLPEQRQPRPAADAPKNAGQDPEQKSAQGDRAENCAEPQAENCTSPEQKTAHEQNETNGKGEKPEGDPVADAASVATAAGAETSADDDGTLFGTGEITASKSSKTPGKRRRAPMTPAPDRIEVTLPMRQWARENGITADLVMETAQFLDHHRAKDNEFRDWVAAWRTWMRNTLKYAPGGSGARGGTPGNHLPVNSDDESHEQNRRAFG
ncbi:helix-turn-helix domain-containing protein [Nonomuraea sp. NPDC005650]|uniref:helix-turn-helix domain-containing protein n=1 Tax=Nonomuraea sp. NPDC005650 TaxID=3157045 RepID=UPI0033AE3388